MEKFSSALKKIVDGVVEKHLATAVEKLNVSCEVNKMSVERITKQTSSLQMKLLQTFQAH